MRRLVLPLASLGLVVLLASGVALAATVDCVVGEAFCVGTKKDDTLNGSEEREELYGLEGADQIFANGGDDDAFGGHDTDTIKGGEGADVLRGQKGRDKIYGEGGNDDLSDGSYRCPRSKPSRDDKNLLDGGEGDDYLYGQTKLYGSPGTDEIDGAYQFNGSRMIDGGPGPDVITSSGYAADTIYVQDGERDEVSCGPKTDTVYYDEGVDVVNPVSCERRITEAPPEG